MSDTAMTQRQTGWGPIVRAVTFWILAVLGLPIMTAAWLWLNFASGEESSEQAQAVKAGTSMAGTTLLLGGGPLLLAHVLGVVTLAAVTTKGRHGRRAGWLFAVIAVVTASVMGLVATLIVTGGHLIIPVDDRYTP